MFTHLHVHTEYSLLDGLSRIPALVSRAKEQGFTSLAITDHGNLYGSLEFYKECRKAGSEERGAAVRGVRRVGRPAPCAGQSR